MGSDLEILKRLQDWYSSVYNGDWEHTYGIFISNVDNPGWSVKVELQDTYLCDCIFGDIKIQRDEEQDWIICKKESGNFQGYCGPRNLTELLVIFLDWAEAKRNFLTR